MTKCIRGLMKRLRITCVMHLLMISLIIYCLIHLYDYDYISADEIDSYLYKKVNPSLKLNPMRPSCEYDFVNNNNTLYNKELPADYNDFSAVGVENGSYVPTVCNPTISVAILITYMKREKQLDTLLPFLHNFLRRQHIHYKIFVIEQLDDGPFNKGVLYNIGAKQAMIEKFPCLILHDVDLLPLDDANLYACLNQPRHLSVSIDSMRYVLMYHELIGGVCAIQSDHYKLINGFSNKFTGWGGEDDNFYLRMHAAGLMILRFPWTMARYVMMKHPKELPNKERYVKLYQSEQDMHAEGLNTVKYMSREVKSYRLFTWIGVRTISFNS